MRYEILQKNIEYMQFISLPERYDYWAYPHVAQFRLRLDGLHRLEWLLEKAVGRVKFAENSFHKSEEARKAWHNGDVVCNYGDPLLVAVMRERRMTVLADSTVLFKDVLEHAKLLRAVRKAIKKMESGK